MKNSEQEQIEEMAKVIRHILENRTDICFIPDLDKPIAEELLKHYQLKLPKDSVVLSMEEYKRITKELVTEQRATEIAKEYFEKIRKETAKKILNDLVKNCQYTFNIDGKPIVELDGDFVLDAAKSYGIKIKE